MKPYPFAKFYVALIGLTLVLGWLIQFVAADRMAQLQAEQTQFRASRQAAWLQTDSEHALAVSQKAGQEIAAQTNRLIAALGGPLGAALKNPELDVRRMLEQLAAAYAPAQTEISVSVDRFTEFDVAFVLHNSLTFPRLAALAKHFLTYGLPYVHSVRFIQGNEVLGELNESAIESVTNWNGVSLATVQDLLLVDDPQNQPAIATTADPAETAGSSTDEDLTADGIKIKAANTIFQQHFSAHAHALTQLINDLDQAARLDSITGADQLSARIRSLDAFTARIAAERDFFMNQSEDMETLWQDQGLSELQITILKRSNDRRSAGRIVAATDLCEAMAGEQEQVRKFLTSMQSDWGDWSGTATGSQIELQFTTAAAKDDYEKQWRRVQGATEAVRNAVRRWQNAMTVP
jgi:hypothetical protein